MQVKVFDVSEEGRVPVDLHANWFGSRRGFRRLHDLLDQLAADLVVWQEDICLVSGHAALQTNKVKHRQVAALGTKTTSIINDN